MSIEGLEFSVPDDFVDLLYALDDADGIGSAIQVYNKKMEDIFEKVGLIKKNIRGSCYGTKKLHSNIQALVDTYFKTMPDVKP